MIVMLDPDDLVDERPWRLEVNGETVIEGTYRPGRLRELVLGRLRTEGMISGMADVLRLDLDESPNEVARVTATVNGTPFASADAERQHRRDSGCGLLHFVLCEPRSLYRERHEELPGRPAFRTVFRELFAAADRESPRGGVHAAALTDGKRLHATEVDIGRHNAVDKVIGRALAEGLSLHALGLVVTSRISAEIARKAAVAGVAWVASRSTPSTLAARIAEAANMPLIARAARREAAP